MTVFRRGLALVLRPVLRLVARRIEVSDPWQRETGSASLALLGTGARHDFAWYFEGESRVRVRSLDDIQEWLDGCRYVSDRHLFHESDYWQHPSTFEQIQRGDCEDFALWTWRKLVELGYDADLVVGRRALEEAGVPDRRLGVRHAWVMFRRDGEESSMNPCAAIAVGRFSRSVSSATFTSPSWASAETGGRSCSAASGSA